MPVEDMGAGPEAASGGWDVLPFEANEGGVLQ